MNATLAIALSSLLLACGGGHKPAATPSPTPMSTPAATTSPDCEGAITHSLALSKDMLKGNGVDDAGLAKMHDLGVQHCKADKWSDEAVKCMLDAKAMQDSQACYGKLTPEQQQSMNSAAGA